MELVLDCSNCKQFVKHKKCVHTLLLETDARDYLAFSDTCEFTALAAYALLTAERS